MALATSPKPTVGSSLPPMLSEVAVARSAPSTGCSYQLLVVMPLLLSFHHVLNDKPCRLLVASSGAGTAHLGTTFSTNSTSSSSSGSGRGCADSALEDEGDAAPALAVDPLYCTVCEQKLHRGPICWPSHDLTKAQEGRDDWDKAGMVEEDGEDGEDEATDIGAAGRQQRQRGWQSGGEGQATA